MLEYLGIENLAVIQKAEIEFEEGLNIITGETGAGKSMVVQALSLLRGERAKSAWIRSGERNARIEAVVDPEAFPLPPFLNPEELGEESITLERVVRETGKGRIRINGTLSKGADLKALTGSLVELSSQHDQQILLSPGSYLALLDDYGDHNAALLQLRERIGVLEACAQEYQRFLDQSEQQEQALEQLSYTLKELTLLNPREGELEALLQKRKRLRASHEIVETAVRHEERLYSADGSAVELLHLAQRDLRQLAHLEPAFEKSAALLAEATEFLEEAVNGLRRFVDPEEDLHALEQTEQRLHALERAMARHGVSTVKALLELKERTERELRSLADLDATREERAQALEQAKTTAFSAAQTLHDARIEAAKRLSEAITAELQELGFPSAQFIVEVKQVAPKQGTPPHRILKGVALTQRGISRVAFLFNANPGEVAREVHQGASGGELSRIHLAMKVALARGDRVMTTVYDEVDAGIGGPVATAVGEKLKLVACDRQVICITHLPQIAAFADAHFRVYKEVLGERTFTRIKRLEGGERVEEIARMLGGVTPESRRHAQALLGLR